jgi:2'-5' RNA ligase
VDYHLSMLRTGLIVEVPDAEDVVAHWREQLDPHAMLGVPAHVTLLFPFAAPDRINEGILTALRQVLSVVEPFEFRLTRTGWFGGSVLWLAPEPGAPFRHLTEVLTAAFPDYPPFGGQFAEIVPHLTVGDHGTEQQLSAAERDVQHHLPIHSNAQAVTLMAEQADGRWHRRARLAFGQRH